MCSILVVGDGNFSFSMALATMLKHHADVQLLATSFDDNDSLQVRKLHCNGLAYP